MVISKHIMSNAKALVMLKGASGQGFTRLGGKGAAVSGKWVSPSQLVSNLAISMIRVVAIAADAGYVLSSRRSMALLRGSDNPAYRLRAGNAYHNLNKHAGFPPSSSE